MCICSKQHCPGFFCLCSLDGELWAARFAGHPMHIRTSVCLLDTAKPWHSEYLYVQEAVHLSRRTHNLHEDSGHAVDQQQPCIMAR